MPTHVQYVYPEVNAIVSNGTYSQEHGRASAGLKKLRAHLKIQTLTKGI